MAFTLNESLQIDEHWQFVKITFSKSFSDRVAHLTWLFIWTYAGYKYICGYPYDRIHYDFFQFGFMRMCAKFATHMRTWKKKRMPTSIGHPCRCEVMSCGRDSGQCYLIELKYLSVLLLYMVSFPMCMVSFSICVRINFPNFSNKAWQPAYRILDFLWQIDI